MIALGLRLVVNGGREAITRLVILAAAVGLGAGLLLTAVAATNAVSTWNGRHAWFWTGTASEPPGPATAGTAPLWWHPGGDIFDGQQQADAEADRDGQDDQPGDRLAAAADHQPQTEGDHAWAPVSVPTFPSLTTTSRSA